MSWNFEEALSYYRSQGAPSDQNALKNLLTEIQQEQGGAIPAWVLPRISDAYGVKETFLTAVIRRFPSLRLETGTHCLELCGGSGCHKRAHLLDFVEKTYGKHPTAFTLRVTPCMHMCGQGPMLRWDGEIHCGVDEQLIRTLVEGIAAGESKKSRK